LQHRWKTQPALWAAVALVILVAAVVTLILLNRPEARAYQDAVLVYAGGTAL